MIHAAVQMSEVNDLEATIEEMAITLALCLREGKVLTIEAQEELAQLLARGESVACRMGEHLEALGARDLLESYLQVEATVPA